jgi:two-component sensor histidine kinase
MIDQRLAANATRRSAPPHLLEEINHRVINEYSEAISFLSLAATRSSSAEARADLANASERLRAFAEMHRALSPPDSDGPVELGGYISRLCATVLNASLAENGVKISLKTDDVWLAADRCWRIGLIVAELIRNAFRHGFSGGAGAISLEVAERSGWVCFHIHDDGRASPNSAPGRGRRLVESIAAELGGSVVWSFAASGSLARLEVPVTGELLTPPTNCPAEPVQICPPTGPASHDA